MVRFGGIVADIVVDNCAICRNHIMDLCELFPPSLNCLFALSCSQLVFSRFISRVRVSFSWLIFLVYDFGPEISLQALSARLIRLVRRVRSALWLGFRSLSIITAATNMLLLEIGVCNHAFHFHCISRWLKTRQVCPLGNPFFCCHFLSSFFLLWHVVRMCINNYFIHLQTTANGSSRNMGTRFDNFAAPTVWILLW
ncbi:hypothetical protein BHE74_00019271 [Ensete ventricosum]|nr:hypothetical protein GW17_00005743 [Ensete ventricosum]RWW72887.1 hypothetical protein BHE74_00019271 [Ensete ventricosum]